MEDNFPAHHFQKTFQIGLSRSKRCGISREALFPSWTPKQILHSNITQQICEHLYWNFRRESSKKRETSLQLLCALNNLPKEMFLDLVRSVFFEKRLSCVVIRIQCLSAATLPKLGLTAEYPATYLHRFFGAKVLTNVKQIFQPSCSLKYFSKKTFIALIRSAVSAVQKFELWHFVLIIHYSCRGMTRLLFYGFGETRIIFLSSSENDFQC